MIKQADQGDPIGIEITFENAGVPYDCDPSFAAITPTGRKIDIAPANVTHVGTGVYRAWHSSKAAAGDWRIEAYGDTDADPVGVAEWRVRPTRING